MASSAETIGAFNTGFDTVNLQRPTRYELCSLFWWSCSMSSVAWITSKQGLTLVHFSAQPKPFLVTEATASVHFSAQPETLLPVR